MSFITESKKAYRQVELLEKENSDHEISMARSELESTADKALAISSMLQSKSDIGNPLEAWVQSKITKAKDYITSVHDYLKYTPGMNESFDLEENTFEKIYQMQQDGKSSEDIAKELKLNPALVKKVLGEQIELKEFTDAQIAQLKKEYDPLKGKTITTSQYQQLKNILFKLKDGDLEKLQKQNIPFASTGAGSILRVRKAPVKITNIKVPGLEGMAEEKIPQGYLDYLRTIVYKKVDFYEIPPKHIIQHWRDEKNKDRFTGKIIDYKEAVDMSKVTKYKMISIKGDQKEITIDREDLEKHLKLGYVIKEPLTEEPKNPYAIGMAEKNEILLDELFGISSNANHRAKVIKMLDDMNIETEKNGTNGLIIKNVSKEKQQSILHKIKKEIGSPTYQVKEEEVELQEKPSIKQYVVFHSDDSPTKHKDFKAYDETELNKQIGEFLKQNPGYKVYGKSPSQSVKETFKDNIVNKLVKPVQDYNKKAAEKRTIDMTDGSAHVRFPKDDTRAMEFYKSKGYKVTTKYEETELEEACWTGYKKVGMKKKGDQMVPNCVPEGYVTESGDIVEFVEIDEGQFKEIDTRKGDLKLAKDKKQNLKDKYNAIMAGQATGDENSIADQIQKLDMSIKKQEQELIDIMKKQRETKKEEVELKVEKVNKGAKALVEAITALQNKADKSGMSYSILKQVYDRGMAAWKGGHRPGAGQHQWAFARVNSFVTKSSGTWGGADSDLAKKVKGKE